MRTFNKYVWLIEIAEKPAEIHLKQCPRCQKRFQELVLTCEEENVDLVRRSLLRQDFSPCIMWTLAVRLTISYFEAFLKDSEIEDILLSACPNDLSNHGIQKKYFQTVREASQITISSITCLSLN